MKSDKTEGTEQGVNKSNYTHRGRDYKLTIAWEEKNKELTSDISLKTSSQAPSIK